MNLPAMLPYHPRAQLIDEVWRVYDSGLANAITLFAPRRQGKTLFVTKELLPSAEARRMPVCYLDLWQRRNKPELALTEGLEAAAAIRKPRWRLKSVKGSIAAGPAKVEATGEAPQLEPQTALENRLRDALVALLPAKGTLLLVLDEFQALAGTKTESFVAAFRTVLQQNSDRIRVFYTGSSRHALNTMFRRQRAPLFASAHPMRLPELREDFSADRAAYLEQRIGQPVDADALHRVFIRLRHTPAFLNSVVLIMLVRESANVEEAFETWLDEQRAEGGSDFIPDLRDIDLAILQTLTSPNPDRIFASKTAAAISEALGRNITTGQIQTAITRMSKAHVIAPTGEPGGYSVDDPSLYVYLTEIVPRGVR